MGERAENVIKFIETYCTLEDGSPFILLAWQKRFIRAIYPGKPHEKRKIDRVILSTGRKSGKSSLAAALALVHTIGPEAQDGKKGICMATSRDQAAYIFDPLLSMIEATENLEGSLNLAQYIEIKRSTRSILTIPTKVGFRVIASRVSTSQGAGVNFWLYDEMAQAAGLSLYQSLDKATKAQTLGSMGIILSTLSETPGNPLANLINTVKTGKEVGGFENWHLEIWRADPEADDPYDLENIKKANPSYPITPTPESVAKEVEMAKLSPADRAHFKCYTLNLDSSPHVALCDPLIWRKAATKETQPEMLEKLKGERVHCGLDLSSVVDLTALALYFPDHHFLALDAWLPTETLQERTLEDQVPYKTWAEDGLLRTIEGRVIEHDIIYDRLCEISEHYQFETLRYDRWRASRIIEALKQRPVSLEVHEFGQGYKDMAPAIEYFEQLLLSGRLRHANHPILKMGILNCRVDFNQSSLDTTERKPKKATPQQKIDPAVASLMAIGHGPASEPPDADSYFLPTALEAGREISAREAAQRKATGGEDPPPAEHPAVLDPRNLDPFEGEI